MPISTTEPNVRTSSGGKVINTEGDYRRVLTADTLEGTRVVNGAREDLGKVQDIMIDLEEGRVAYVVLSFGGFLGMGDKLFAVPWDRVRVDQDEKELIFDIDRETLERAPGFDRDNWPDFADPTLGREIYNYYGSQPYWDTDTTTLTGTDPTSVTGGTTGSGVSGGTGSPITRPMR